MSKQIKFSISNTHKHRLILEEKANKDDFIDLLPLSQASITEYLDFIKQEEMKIKNNIKEKLRIEVAEEVKQKTINYFKANDETYQKSLIADLKIKNLEEKIEKLKDDETKNNIINLFKQGEEYQSQITTINDLKNKLKNLKTNEQELKQKTINEYKNSDEFQEDIDKKTRELSKEIEELRNSKTRNSAIIGEELSSWVNNELKKVYGNSDEVEIIKEPKPIAGKKPDFLIKFFDKKNRSYIGGIVIENKNQAKGGNHKNKEYFEKLASDKNNFLSTHPKSSYGLLVTELEDQEQFAIQTINTDSNLYMVRPHSLISLVTFLKKTIDAGVDIQNIDIHLRRKQEILEEFEEIKKKAFVNIFENINKKGDAFDKEINKMESSIQNLIKLKQDIVDNFIIKIQNKIEKFKIDKITKKIDLIEPGDENGLL